jgi:hypothetical protein
MVLLGTTHKLIRVVNTKLELMKFKLCTWELRLETRVNQGKNIDYNGFKNYPCNAKMLVVFYNVKHYMCDVGRKRSMCHNS